MSTTSNTKIESECIGRRQFLLFAGATTVGLGSLGISVPAYARQPVAARVSAFERRKIARLADLRVDDPTYFLYPWNHPHCRNLLVKTGTPCGGGVGPDADIVAFNQICTHQGGLLEGLYDADHKVSGPCPLHLTTYDLKRYGMVVAGHSTEGLPQIVLEVERGTVYAVGVRGLIYGFADNEQGA